MAMGECNLCDGIACGVQFSTSPEAAIALRLRLNELIEQLDTLREAHVLLQVDHENLTRELTVVKSDRTYTLRLSCTLLTSQPYPVNLVNKDQLDILASLRESVNEDKACLEQEFQQLQSQTKELREKNKMQLEQINGLLMEKVHLQSDGIGQREKMLERERNFAYVQCHPHLFFMMTFLEGTCEPHSLAKIFLRIRNPNSSRCTRKMYT